MAEFLNAVRDYAFMRNALLAGLLASIACGIVGSYVVTRRISYIAGGIAHCVLGGLGAVLYLQTVLGWTRLQPLHGAVAAALLAAAVIGWVSLRARQREDTVIGAIWAVGMAVGLLFIARTPGYVQNLMSYLFGNILLVSTRDLWLIAGLDALVIAVSVALRPQLLAVCFDEEFARTRALRTDVYYLVLLALTAITVVVLVAVVGTVLVIALLTLPAAVAGHFSRRLWHMMALACGVCAFVTTAGLAVSFAPDLPAGATIVLLAGAVYLVVALGRRLVRRSRA
jgi:zinc transport system permease protein